MALKVAFCGKGGVGKTTVAALYIRKLAESGVRVVAVDADPVPNLASALGFPRDVRLEPVSALKELVQERTGAQPGWGTLFRLNPRVDDLPERLGATRGNIQMYAGAGEIAIEIVSAPRAGMRVRASDTGPGIADLEEVMAGRTRSKRGMGLGLRGVKAMADDFTIASGRGRGTAVSALFCFPAAAAAS